MSTTSTPAAEPEKKAVEYCDTCKRIKGVGCSCGLTFAEKVRSVGTHVPDHMRAVPRYR